jgi:hypothetical protein
VSVHLGVDPGVSGAAVAIDREGRLIQAIPLPVAGPAKHRRMDCTTLAAFLSGIEQAERDWSAGRGHGLSAAIEELTPMPGRGAIGAMGSGILFGGVLATLELRGWGVELVRSQTWQSVIPGLPSRTPTKGDAEAAKRAKLAAHRKALKEALRDRARLACPELGTEIERLRGKADGFADAYWIARWCASRAGAR